MQGNIAVIRSLVTEVIRQTDSDCVARTLLSAPAGSGHIAVGTLALETKAPAARQGPKERSHQKLERELGRDLDAARSAASQERVADAHVSGGCNLVGAVADLTAGSVRRRKPASATVGHAVRVGE